MTATVRIPTPLRSFTGGADELSVDGRTIGEVLEHLTRSCDGLGERVLDREGRLRHFVNVYLGSHDVRSLQGLETLVEDGAVVSIVPAVAGGLGRGLTR